MKCDLLFNRHFYCSKSDNHLPVTHKSVDQANCSCNFPKYKSCFESRDEVQLPFPARLLLFFNGTSRGSSRRCS